MPEEEEVVKRSLFLAKKYYNEGMPGRSYAHLLVVLKLKPQWKEKLKNLFISVFCSWDEHLLAEGRYSDLFACYEQALEHYKLPLLYDNLGAILNRLHYRKEAIRYYQLALSLDNEYIRSVKHLYNAYNESVERWHFRMLNDDIRNNSFREAISGKIKEGHAIVFDIGTGTGLLSIFATREGAQKVYACDYSTVMIDLAQQVLSNNVPTDSVILIPKLSNEITIPQDVPNRCSLLVTETMDAALLGERILQTLIHAWENLLLPNCDRTTGNMFGEVIPSGAKLYVTPVECLKIARNNQVLHQDRVTVNNRIKLGSIKFSPIKDEPYDTENLRLTKHTYLSDPIEIFNFNFNNVDELRKFIEGSKNKRNVDVSCSRNGFIDAFAIWFDLILDNNIIVSSSPENYNKRCCWDQAIFPLGESFSFKENNSVSIDVGCTDGRLEVELSSYPDTDNNRVYVPQKIIRFLNCISIQNAFHNAANKLKTTLPPITIDKVLDLSLFPAMGIQLAQMFNANVISISEIEDKHLDYILNENIIDPNTFKTTRLDDLIGSANTFEFDVIVFDCFESNGLFNESIITSIPKLRDSLKPGGLIFPSKISIYCQLIESEQLRNESEVTNPILMTDIKLAEYINTYKVPYQIDLKMDEVIYKSLTPQFHIGTLSIANFTEEENIVFEKEVELNEAGCMNAILYWFNYESGGLNFSTNALDSFINQSAWLFSPVVNVNKCDKIKIKCIYNECFLYFSVEK